MEKQETAFYKSFPEMINFHNQLRKKAYFTSSNTKLMNLNESSRVRMTSATGTPQFFKGRINHCKANASCSDVVVVKQRLALWKIFQEKNVV